MVINRIEFIVELKDKIVYLRLKEKKFMQCRKPQAQSFLTLLYVLLTVLALVIQIDY